MFLPRWTRKIEDEFVDNWGDVIFSVQKSVRSARKAANLSPPPEHVAYAQKRLNAYRGAVGVEWEVVGYDDPDVIKRVPASVHAGDIHIAAACLVLQDSLSEEPGCNKVFLVSKNLKHLPVKSLKALGIEVSKPGRFIDLLYRMNPVLMERVLRKTVTDLNGYSEEKLLGALTIHGASETARHFSKEWGVELSLAGEQTR